MLTDGCVGNNDQVANQAKKHNDKIKVFTFGLGNGCDRDLVMRTAEAGRGTYTIVEDGCTDLNGKVIKALSNAMEPSLKGVSYGWNKVDDVSKQEIFRNSLVHSTTMLSSAKEMKNLQFSFKSEHDKQTGKKIDFTFKQADFKKVEGTYALALFKMAAFNKIKNIKANDQKIAESVKY